MTSMVRVSSLGHTPPQTITAAPLRHSCGILAPLYAMCPATDRVVKPQVPAALPVPLQNSHGLLDIGFLSRGPSAWVLQV